MRIGNEATPAALSPLQRATKLKKKLKQKGTIVQKMKEQKTRCEKSMTFCYFLLCSPDQKKICTPKKLLNTFSHGISREILTKSTETYTKSMISVLDC